MKNFDERQPQGSRRYESKESEIEQNKRMESLVSEARGIEIRKEESNEGRTG